MKFNTLGYDSLDAVIDRELDEAGLQGYDLDDIIDEELNRVEVMGADLDDSEEMSGIFKKLFKRIQKRIRARRKSKGDTRSSAPGGVQSRNYALTTPSGTFAYNKTGGLNYTDPNTGLPITTGPQNFMDKIKANPMPWVLGGGAVAALVILKKK